jgi:hypothetical protein
MNLLLLIVLLLNANEGKSGKELYQKNLIMSLKLLLQRQGTLTKGEGSVQLTSSLG